MSNDDKEKTNPLTGIYGLGVIGWTALLYSQEGFWMALAQSLIWPVYVGIWIWDKFK